MGHKNRIDGVGRDTTAGRCLVDGVGYSIKKGRTLDDGVGYDVAFGASGMAAGDLAVGSSVFANVNGVRTEFLVVHQGLPSSMYDASCDGTWLLMKDIWKKDYYATDISATYSSSLAHKTVNVDFLNLLEANVQNAIKPVLIPYATASSGSAVSSGANGLDVKAFFLSGRECGLTSASLVNDGVCLSYFSSAVSDKSIRIAYLNGAADMWGTRSKITTDSDVPYFAADGGGKLAKPIMYLGYRPAFILDSSAAIDPDTFDILG